METSFVWCVRNFFVLFSFLFYFSSQFVLAASTEVWPDAWLNEVTIEPLTMHQKEEDGLLPISSFLEGDFSEETEASFEREFERSLEIFLQDMLKYVQSSLQGQVVQEKVQQDEDYNDKVEKLIDIDPFPLEDARSVLDQAIIDLMDDKNFNPLQRSVSLERILKIISKKEKHKIFIKKVLGNLNFSDYILRIPMFEIIIQPDRAVRSVRCKRHKEWNPIDETPLLAQKNRSEYIKSKLYQFLNNGLQIQDGCTVKEFLDEYNGNLSKGNEKYMIKEKDFIKFIKKIDHACVFHYDRFAKPARIHLIQNMPGQIGCPMDKKEIYFLQYTGPPGPVVHLNDSR